jgi:hypothetical protein
MSNDKYAPTPWHLDKEGGDIRAADNTVVLYLPTKEMDMDFAAAIRIVNAINAHDELVAALKHCYALFDDIRNDWTDPRSQCREGWAIISAALAKVKP